MPGENTNVDKNMIDGLTDKSGQPVNLNPAFKVGDKTLTAADILKMGESLEQMQAKVKDLEAVAEATRKVYGKGNVADEEAKQALVTLMKRNGWTDEEIAAEFSKGAGEGDDKGKKKGPKDNGEGEEDPEALRLRALELRHQATVETLRETIEERVENAVDNFLGSEEVAKGIAYIKQRDGDKEAEEAKKTLREQVLLTLRERLLEKQDSERKFKMAWIGEVAKEVGPSEWKKFARFLGSTRTLGATPGGSMGDDGYFANRPKPVERPDPNKLGSGEDFDSKFDDYALDRLLRASREALTGDSA